MSYLNRINKIQQRVSAINNQSGLEIVSNYIELTFQALAQGKHLDPYTGDFITLEELKVRRPEEYARELRCQEREARANASLALWDRPA